jgi:predicted hotdog family 3-hydroxylacyl-ACP dehydratase
VNELESVKRDYRVAFLRYLPHRDEAALHLGYLIGRRAVAQGISILDIAQIHHEALLEVLRDTRGEDLNRIAAAASEFLVEVLATAEMRQRGFLAGSPISKPQA